MRSASTLTALAASSMLTFALRRAHRSNAGLTRALAMQPPHAFCNAVFFRSGRVGINRGGFQVGMPEPLLDLVQRHAVDGGFDPETMPQAFRRCVRAFDLRGIHHVDNAA